MKRRKVVVEVAKKAGEDMDTATEALARVFDVPSNWKDGGCAALHWGGVKKKLCIEGAGEKVIGEVVRRLAKKKQSYLSKYNILYYNPSNPSSPFSIQTRTVEQFYAL